MSSQSTRPRVVINASSNALLQGLKIKDKQKPTPINTGVLINDMVFVIVPAKKCQIPIPRLVLLEKSNYYAKIHEFDPSVPTIEIEDCTPTVLQLVLGYMLDRFALGAPNYPALNDVDKHDIYETELSCLSKVERTIFSSPIGIRTELLFLAEFLQIPDLITLLRLSFQYAVEEKTVEEISGMFQQPLRPHPSTSQHKE